MDPVSNPEAFAAGIGIFTIVIIAVSVIVPLGITGAIFYVVFKKINANKALVASGEPAQAQVLSASETGTRLNDQPEVVFALQVMRHGHPPYQANASAYVSQFNIPKLQPGSVVPVKVDPGNPLQVAIDMTQLASMPMGGMQMYAGSQPMGGAQMYGGSQPMGGAPMQPGSQPNMMQQQGSSWQCPACRQAIQPGSPSCPYCGTRLQ